MAQQFLDTHADLYVLRQISETRVPAGNVLVSRRPGELTCQVGSLFSYNFLGAIPVASRGPELLKKARLARSRADGFRTFLEQRLDSDVEPEQGFVGHSTL